MKFDFCIGNPAYQETKGGTKNIDIWPNFIDSSTKVADTVVAIHPGRWLVPKKQMQKIHDNILESGLKRFNYFPDSTKLFSSGISVDGGITVTCFKAGYDGDIAYYNEGVLFGSYDDKKKFFSSKYEEEAYRKIWAAAGDKENMLHRVAGNIGSLGGSEYGYKKTKDVSLLADSPEGMTEPIKIWANSGFGRGTHFQWHYIDKKKLTNPPEKIFTTRKVMIDKKGNSLLRGKGNVINNIPQIVDANVIASGDVLFVFPEQDTDYDLQLIKSMFMSKIIRFLMSITQKDLYVRGFENIPDYTFFKSILNGELFTDEWAAKYFSLSEELMKHINSCVSPKSDEPEKEMT